MENKGSERKSGEDAAGGDAIEHETDIGGKTGHPGSLPVVLRQFERR
jgi:hypothetical protein